jgi:hypothetical protein
VYRKVIGTDDYAQLTVIDGDLVSYTVVVPEADLKLAQGSLVSLRIAAVETIRDALFICKSLNTVRIETSSRTMAKDQSSTSIPSGANPYHDR